MSTDPEYTQAQAAPPQRGPGSLPPGAQQPPQAAPRGTPPLPQHKIRHTRISGLWFAVVIFALVLLLLLIFIVQNSKMVDVSYLGAHGHVPLGVALLFAAVCGVLLVILAGVARISQLRATARRHRRADAQRVAAANAPAQPPG